MMEEQSTSYAANSQAPTELNQQDKLEIKSSLSKLLYVKNFNSKICSERGLKKFFKQFGLIHWIELSKSSKQRCAFVRFSQSSAASLAASASYDQLIMDRRRLEVQLVSDSRRHIQQKAQQILEKKVSESKFDKSRATISQLNDDCLVVVFTFLDYQTRICCERVCKRWRDLSKQSWSSIHHIEFSQDVAGNSFTDLDIVKTSAVLERAKGHVLSLVFNSDQGWDIHQQFPQIIKMIAPTISHIAFGGMRGFCYKLVNMLGSKAPNLKSLDFLGCSRLKFKSFENLVEKKCDIDSLSLGYMTEVIPLFPRFRHLKILTFLGTGMDSKRFKEFLASTTTLEVLTIDGDLIWNSFDDLTFSSLKKLNILECIHLDRGADTFQFYHCPNLVELRLGRVLISSPPQIPLILQRNMWERLGTSCPKLQHLTLEQNNNMRMGIYMQQGVKEIIKSHKQDAMQSLSKLQSLTYLNVNIKLDALGSELKAVANLKNLETCIIFSWQCVYTEEDLVFIINELTKLKLLDIRGAHVKPFGAAKNVPVRSNKDIRELCDRLNPRQSLLELKITSCGYESHSTRERWRYRDIIVNQWRQFGVDEISMSHREHRVTYLTSDECRASTSTDSTSTDSSARNESRWL